MKKVSAYAIIGLVVISPFLKGLFYPTETLVILTVIALLSVLYFITRLRENDDVQIDKRLVVIGLLLVAAYMISFINAACTRENLYSISQYLGYLVMLVVLVDYFKGRKQQFGWAVMFTVMISGFVNALVGIEALTGAIGALNGMVEGKRVGATFEYANTAAAYFAICLLFTLVLFSTSKNTLLRAFIIGAGNVILIAFLLTGSRGGIIAGFAAFLVFFLVQPRHNKLRTMGAFLCEMLPSFFFITRIISTNKSLKMLLLILLSSIAASILGGLYIFLLKRMPGIKHKRILVALTLSAIGLITLSFLIRRGLSGVLPELVIRRFVQMNLYDTNIFVRLKLDQWAIKIISGHWLSGAGGDGWNSLYYGVQDIFLNAKDVHNNYFQVFIESGILGIISYVALLVTAFCHMARALRKTTDMTDKFFLTGFLSGFMIIAFHSSFDFDLSFASMALMLWVMIAASSIFQPYENDIQNSGKRVTGGAVKLTAVVICAILISVNGLFALSSFHADKGKDDMESGDLQSAMVNYLEASRIDPINPYYGFQLAKIYNAYADASKDPEKSKYWRDQAVLSAEKSVKLNRFFPSYREVLALAYFGSDMPIKALESVELLVKLQPCKIGNYELLARGYMESAKYYIEANNIEKAKELLASCSRVDSLPYVEANTTISSYKEQALSLLGKY